MDNILDHLYKILFETAAEGLIVVDSKSNILKINKRTEELFDFKENELIGQSVSLLIPEKYRPAHAGHHKSYMENPRKRSMGHGMGLYARRKDGSVFPVEISLNYFINDDQKYAMALITDITERKENEAKIIQLNTELENRVEQRTKQLETINKNLQIEIQERKKVEEELKESQFLYSMIARNFPNGTINVFDKNLNYVFVEGKELYRMGITGEKLIGTKFTSRLEPKMANDIEKELNDVFKGKSKTIELQYRNNSYVLFAVPLKSEKGIDRIMVVETNITQQKKAQADIQVALEKEKELNELKSRFVSMASHEFRTPLGTILSSVTLIEKYRKSEDDEKRKKHIYRIKSSVNNLTGILNDFLSIDKLEEGKIRISKQDYSVKEICEELTEEMRAVAKLGQKIYYQHSGKIENFEIDKQIIRNILINLLSNAIKYSDENKEIEFTSAIENNKLKFEVKDQGIGIPANDQQYLFDRFFRASNSINIQGTGLGLNIVCKYLELIGGNINFNSKEGKGTTFIIDIK